MKLEKVKNTYMAIKSSDELPSNSQGPVLIVETEGSFYTMQYNPTGSCWTTDFKELSSNAIENLRRHI